MAAYNKQHVAKNAVRYREIRKSKRREKLAWYLFLECRARAKRLGFEFNLEPSDIVVPVACPVFGFVLDSAKRDTSASVDRIDSSLGYVRGNVRVISYLANRMKSNASPEQLITFAQWILENFNGSARGMDTTKGTRPDPNQHAHEAAYGSRTWESGNDLIPGNRWIGSFEENSPGSSRH